MTEKKAQLKRGRRIAAPPPAGGVSSSVSEQGCLLVGLCWSGSLLEIFAINVQYNLFTGQFGREP